MGISFVRVDVDKEKEMAVEYDISNLPMILAFNKCKNKGMYKGVHSPAALQTSVSLPIPQTQLRGHCAQNLGLDMRITASELPRPHHSSSPRV
eukprot:2755580-Rhodomonas_salina.1